MGLVCEQPRAAVLENLQNTKYLLIFNSGFFASFISKANVCLRVNIQALS